MDRVQSDLAELLKIEVSDDRMEARLIIIGDTKKSSVDEYVKFLNTNGITFGIQFDKLNMVSALKIGQGIVCAQGQPPGATQQPKIDYFFPLSAQNVLETLEGCCVDLRETSVINNAESGKILAVTTPGILGTNGVDVNGNTVLAEPLHEVEIIVGDFVELTSDGLKAVAKTSGLACCVGGAITIVPKIRISGDVDYSVGNIKFGGDLEIHGNVLSGFTVKVDGSLTISKNIENANIKVGKDLFVGGNVFGRGECKLEVGGKAVLNEIDSATVDVLGDLLVCNGIRHSTVRCGGRIEVTANNGVIVGGDVSAFGDIKVSNLGNAIGTLTSVSVGVDPFIRQQIEIAAKAIEELSFKLTQIQNHTAVIERRLASLNQQSSLVELKNTLKAAELAVLSEIKENELKGADLRERIADECKASIEVNGMLFANVSVAIRRGKVRICEERKNIVLEEVNGEVLSSTLNST